ncbi:MAG TPA: hypothetical protein VOB72_07375 [Candidatus Dormibacteraeota bacterium]|nr:hypothetical protein [Candidatus Dormibacteraeota bacterium]
MVRRRQGEPRSWRSVWFAALAAFVLAGCAGPFDSRSGPGPTRAPDTRPATEAPAASLAEWEKRGATEVPPADVQRVSLDGIEVANDTRGAVTDADVRTWAGALLRSYGYLLWAVGRGQDQFLLRSGLSSAAQAVFRPNLNDIALARQAGARVEYSREVFRRLVLRPVPQSLQATFQAEQFAWKPYAFFIDAVGPITTTWIDRQGGRTVKSQLPPGAAAYELMGGELAHDQLLGDVWVLASDWNCTADSTRRGLSPLCNA